MQNYEKSEGRCPFPSVSVRFWQFLSVSVSLLNVDAERFRYEIYYFGRQQLHSWSPPHGNELFAVHFAPSVQGSDADSCLAGQL
jgi:hypothetical protein